MRLRVRPSSVAGRVRAPPSKSYTHRAILLAALSGGPCRVRNPLRSEDTEATAAGVEAFGAQVAWDAEAVRIVSDPFDAAGAEVDARNSGTTLRLLSGVAATLDATTRLTGDASLRRRPMGPLLVALQGLGATAVSLPGDGCPPVEVAGPMRGGEVSIPGAVSSQFVSSLLLACPLAHGRSVVHVLPPLRSEPYVEVTLHMIRRFGGRVDAKGSSFHVDGMQSYRPVDLDVPGDFSSAAFPLVAAVLTHGEVTVEGLDAGTPQGDARVVSHLRGFGAAVEERAGSIRCAGGALVGRTIDIGDTPDLFPVLAVLATQARGESRFVNGEHLRIKESDRIATTTAFLTAMGADVDPTRDGCVVRGPTALHEAFVDSQGDHRILMAAAVAALVADGPVDISDPWAFRVSYPGFLDDLRRLGADAEVVG